MANSIQVAFKQVFGNDRVRVIIARDRDITLVSLHDNVNVWGDLTKTVSLRTMQKGDTLRVPLVGWPVKNERGQIMVPILYGGKRAWVQHEFVVEN